MDFRSPSLNQVAEFLLFLFKEKNLQPSTIDGYRTVIAGKIGCDKVDFGKDENLTRLLDSFHRDKPKGLRGVPSWNLSLVLHQLTQSPFEPLRKASLKHLTFKTVFLLALGSGKRRSEIHAWVHRNIRHQEDWGNVSLFPSPCFLSKNQLAREGPSSVAPVIIRPWPLRWTSLSRRIEPYVQFGLCVITWTRPKTSVQANSWSLCLSRRTSIRTSLLLRFLLGLNKPSCCAINCPMRMHSNCIRSEPMMCGPLQLLRLFKEVCPWTRSSQPATESRTIPSPNFI